MKFKRCACCGRELPITEFSSNKRNADGLHSYCKSCNALKAKEFRMKVGPEYLAKYSKRQRDSGYFRFGKGAYINMKKSSTKRGIAFTLTQESLKEWWKSQPDKCHYCECDLEEYISIKNFIKKYVGNDELINYIKTHVYNKDNYYRIESMTIDRIDSFGPYSVDNMVKACWICNSIKSNSITYDEMKKKGKDILKHIRMVMQNERKK